MAKDNSNKNKKVVGFISPHQWGIVLDRGGVRQHKSLSNTRCQS